MSPPGRGHARHGGPIPTHSVSKTPYQMLFNPATGFSFSGLCAGLCQILGLFVSGTKYS